MGLDLINGAVRDKKAGVLEPAVSKIKSLKFATEAAITILRIDDMIKLAPEKSEEGSYGDTLLLGESCSVTCFITVSVVVFCSS